MFGKRKRKHKMRFVFVWLGTFFILGVPLCLLFFYGDENIQAPPFSCENAEVSLEEPLTDKITENASEDDLSDESSLNSNLETWVGEYDFFEGYFDPTFNHPPLNMSYHIQIYENEGSYYADLEIDGHMTYTKIRAGVYGDEECINMVFLEYLPENMGNEIYDDCELLSFRKVGEDIYTYWGKVEAIFYENQNPGEIYFTKVGVE